MGWLGAAWSKRGHGRRLDSCKGYRTIIGFLSSKRYANDLGHKKSNYDCRKEFDGRAKAMDPDGGKSLAIKKVTFWKMTTSKYEYLEGMTTVPL